MFIIKANVNLTKEQQILQSIEERNITKDLDLIKYQSAEKIVYDLCSSFDTKGKAKPCPFSRFEKLNSILSDINNMPVFKGDKINKKEIMNQLNYYTYTAIKTKQDWVSYVDINNQKYNKEYNEKFNELIELMEQNLKSYSINELLVDLLNVIDIYLIRILQDHELIYKYSSNYYVHREMQLRYIIEYNWEYIQRSIFRFLNIISNKDEYEKEQLIIPNPERLCQSLKCLNIDKILLDINNKEGHKMSDVLPNMLKGILVSTNKMIQKIITKNQKIYNNTKDTQGDNKLELKYWDKDIIPNNFIVQEKDFNSKENLICIPGETEQKDDIKKTQKLTFTYEESGLVICNIEEIKEEQSVKNEGIEEIEVNNASIEVENTEIEEEQSIKNEGIEEIEVNNASIEVENTEIKEEQSIKNESIEEIKEEQSVKNEGIEEIEVNNEAIEAIKAIKNNNYNQQNIIETDTIYNSQINSDSLIDSANITPIQEQTSFFYMIYSMLFFWLLNNNNNGNRFIKQKY